MTATFWTHPRWLPEHTSLFPETCHFSEPFIINSFHHIYINSSHLGGFFGVAERLFFFPPFLKSALVFVFFSEAVLEFKFWQWWKMFLSDCSSYFNSSVPLVTTLLFLHFTSLCFSHLWLSFLPSSFLPPFHDLIVWLFVKYFFTAVFRECRLQTSVYISHPSLIAPSLIPSPPCLFPFQDGVFVRGLYLEGAGWDRKSSCLVEAEPMQMVCPIPTIHFKPVENRKKTAKSESFETFCQGLSIFFFPTFSLVLSFYVICDVTSQVSTLCLSMCRHVLVSVLLLPRAFGRGGPGIFCAQCGTEIRSCDPGPLDQERDRSSHESGQLARSLHFSTSKDGIGSVLYQRI